MYVKLGVIDGLPQDGRVVFYATDPKWMYKGDGFPCNFSKSDQCFCLEGKIPCNIRPRYKLKCHQNIGRISGVTGFGAVRLRLGSLNLNAAA